MSEANVTVVGNVASDVKSYPANNGSVTSFRLASQRRYYNRRTGRWVEEEAAFYRIVCWRGLAEHVGQCVKKGEPVVVHGRLKLKDWTDDTGQRHTDAEIDAWSVAYDLGKGTAVFTRTRKQAQASTEDDPLDHIRTEQRASAGDDVIVDPVTGEMFSVSDLQRDRAEDEAPASSKQTQEADAEAESTSADEPGLAA